MPRRKKNKGARTRGSALEENCAAGEHTVVTGPHISLGVFRVAFGLLFACHLYSWFKQKAILALFEWANFNFPYRNMEWLHAGPFRINPRFLHALVLPALIGLSVFFGLGCGGNARAHRITCSVLLGGYAYIFFLSKIMYVNHHYLYLLFLFMLALSPTTQLLVFRPFTRKKQRTTVDPGGGNGRFERFCLRALIAVVYFYAGIAKLQSEDWIYRGEPLRMWFFEGSANFQEPMLASTLAYFGISPETTTVTWLALCGSWFSLLLDLFLGPSLLVFSFLEERSESNLVLLLKGLTLVLFGAFHLMNFCLFNIGTFPATMVATSLLFLSDGQITQLYGCFFSIRVKKGAGEKQLQKEEEEKETGKQNVGKHQRQLRKARQQENQAAHGRSQSTDAMTAMIHGALVTVVLFNVLYPARHMMLTDDVNWTAEGDMFSWRMMLNHKHVLARWYAIPKSDRGTQNAKYYSFHTRAPGLRLTQFQREQMKRDPVMIQHFAKGFVAKKAPETYGIQEVAVLADVWQSLNGRCYQRWIKPDIDLAGITYAGLHDHWILPKLPEVNTLEFTEKIKEVERDFLWQGFETAFFCDSPEADWEAFFHEEFAKELYIGVFKGEVEIQVEGQEPQMATLGELQPVPWAKWHYVRNVGTTPSCFYYVWKDQLSGTSFAKSLMMA